MRRDWWVPLTGIAFIALVIIGFAVAGEPPDAKHSAQEIVDFYRDNKDSTEIGSFIGAAGLIFWLFFAAHLSKVLAAAAPADSTLPRIVFAGAVILTTGFAFDLTLTFAIAERAENIPPESIRTLEALWDNDFIPMLLGAATVMLASGLAIIRYGGLPVWLGWIAIALVIVSFTPIGFAGFVGSAVWVLVVSVLLTIRGRRTSGQTA